MHKAMEASKEEDAKGSHAPTDDDERAPHKAMEASKEEDAKGSHAPTDDDERDYVQTTFAVEPNGEVGKGFMGGAGEEWREIYGDSQTGTSVLIVKTIIFYPYAWLDSLLTVFFGALIAYLGVNDLLNEARAGVKWWTCAFWTGPLPDNDDSEESGVKAGAPTAATPLKG